MDNGFPASTRAEMIRQARESCAKNLYATNPKWMDGAINENKEKKIQEQLRKEEKKQIVQTAGALGIKDSPVDAERQTYLKLLLVRTICAVLIALVVITMDQLNLQDSFTKKVDVEAMISSNVTMDQLEQSVSSFIKDTILPVFNGSSSGLKDSEQENEENKQTEQKETENETTRKEADEKEALNKQMEEENNNANRD